MLPLPPATGGLPSTKRRSAATDAGFFILLLLLLCEEPLLLRQEGFPLHVRECHRMESLDCEGT